MLLSRLFEEIAHQTLQQFGQVAQQHMIAGLTGQKYQHLLMLDNAHNLRVLQMKKLIGAASVAIALFAQMIPAHADEMNINVAGWDAKLSKLTTAAGTIITIDQTKVTIPDTLTVGDDVLIEFNSSEDGFTGITGFTITKDN